MAVELVEGGGMKTPVILERILRFRKLSMVLSLVAAFFYCQYVFLAENMELTRMSEHSLMPGYVTSRFDKNGLATQIFKELKMSASSKTQQEKICEYFENWGLSCYEQKWKVNVELWPGKRNNVGKNVYGWVRGSRNDGTEAQLIAVQMGQSDNRIMAVSQILAFVNYAKDQVYWARDIVFVFIDGGESLEKSALAFDTFLSKYHMINDEKLNYSNSSHSIIVSDSLKEHSGILIAGIVYEIENVKKQHTKTVTAKINGINGQQANLDLFNGATKIAYNKYQAKMLIYDVKTEKEIFENPYLIPLRAIYTQAFVSIEGVHSVLGKYGVQGMTIGLNYQMNTAQFGSFFEAMSRMLNNALERLHQSYFMYVLADDMHFVSIAYYTGLIGILIAPLLISAYYEWTQLTSFKIPVHFLIVHAFGYLLYILTVDFYKSHGTVVYNSGIATIDNLIREYYGLPVTIVTGFMAASMIPIGLISFLGSYSKNTESIRVLCQLEAALILGCLSLINFGLAAFSAAVVMPLVFTMTLRTENRLSAIIRTILLMFLNPMIILSSVVEPLNGYLGYRTPTLTTISSKMIRENVLFGTHHLMLFTIFAIPMWNLLFGCSMRWEEPKEDIKEKVE